MKFIHLIIFFELVVVSACNHLLDSSEEFKQEGASVPVKYLPRNPGSLYWANTILKIKNKDLKLYSIENGFDSFQLRIWFNNYDHISDSANHCVIIKKFAENDWKTHLIDFEYVLYGGIADLDKKPKISHFQLPMPNSALTFFDTALHPLLFYGGIPLGCGSIKEEKSDTFRTTNSLLIEFATKERYYLADFPVPSNFNDTCGIDEKPLLQDLLRLLKDDFKLKFVNDYF